MKMKHVIAWESGRGERYISNNEPSLENGTSNIDSALEFDTEEEAYEHINKYCGYNCYVISYETDNQ